MTAPISFVIATRDRPAVLRRVLDGLLLQRVIPAEVIVIDASAGDDTKELVESFHVRAAQLGCSSKWEPAVSIGAAAQRNQGVALATQDCIGFCDDDIIFEPECLSRLWQALVSDERLGGVNAMITNQRYCQPGRVSSALFRILAGARRATYAGAVIGPAVNLLPEDCESLPEIVASEWLNLGCTLYRREALPSPPFQPFFTGYSLMEDLALSLTVGRSWKLANVRAARIYHDSQPGSHKNDVFALAKMEIVNRHHVMRRVLARDSLADYAKLALWECFQVCSSFVQTRGRAEFRSVIAGKIAGIREIARAAEVQGAA